VVGTAGNVLVGHVQIYIAPVGTAGPATSVAYGGAWPAGWLPSGFTEKGLTVNMDRKTTMIYVDEIAEPVAVTTDTNDPSLDIDFAEDTLQSMAWAYGGGTITTTGVGPTQVTTLALSDNLTQVAIGFEGTAPAGNFRRVVIPVLVSTGKVKTTYQRAKAARTYPATFMSLGPLSGWTIQEIGAGVEAQ
jgi:hypothetical protein